MKQVASPIRFVLIALIALAFGAVSIAAAQQVTSTNSDYNTASLNLRSQGETIDRVEFTVENRVVAHPYGNFRPDAYIRVNIPVTNNTERTVRCSVARADAGIRTDRAMVLGQRLADVVAGSSITVAANATGNLAYFLDFKSEDSWNDGDFGQQLAVAVRVTCEGLLPTIQNQSH